MTFVESETTAKDIKEQTNTQIVNPTRKRILITRSRSSTLSTTPSNEGEPLKRRRVTITKRRILPTTTTEMMILKTEAIELDESKMNQSKMSILSKELVIEDVISSSSTAIEPSQPPQVLTLTTEIIYESENT